MKTDTCFMRKCGIDGKRTIKRIIFGIFITLFSNTLFAQTTTSFNTSTASTFTEGGYTFSITNDLGAESFSSWARTGNYVVDNYGSEGKVPEIVGSFTNSSNDFYANSIYVYACNSTTQNLVNGELIIRGKLNGSEKFSVTPFSYTNASGVPNSSPFSGNYVLVDFSTNGYDNILIDELEFELANPSSGTNPLNRLVIDDFTFTINPLPVELTSFTANINKKSVELNWQTATEVNNYGFEVERALSSESDKREGTSTTHSASWETIGFVEGQGNSNSPHKYLYTDKPVSGSKIKYRLKQIDTDGEFEYSPVIEVTLDLPKEFSVKQNYPNPFNPTTKIEYTIPSDNNVEIKVFNSIGMEVATLLNENKEAGKHSVEFNANKLSSGIYFYRIVSGKYSAVKKMILLK